jgi:agmatinase
MPRFGPMYGPDVTFLGIDRCTIDEPGSYAGADVVVLGAPFDGGTSHRPGTRFGPQAIRTTDYLPHDRSRPSLALRVDGLQDLRVLDAGDVEMFSGDAERSLRALEEAVTTVARSGALPLVLGGDHAIAFADAKGVANHRGHGRVSMIHFDAHADTGDIQSGSLWGHGAPMRRLIESGARGRRVQESHIQGCGGPECGFPEPTGPNGACRRRGNDEVVARAHRGRQRGANGPPAPKASFAKRSPMRWWVAASGCSPSGRGSSAKSASP